MQNIIQKCKTLWIVTRASFLALTCLKHLECWDSFAKCNAPVMILSSSSPHFSHNHKDFLPNVCCYNQEWIQALSVQGPLFRLLWNGPWLSCQKVRLPSFHVEFQSPLKDLFGWSSTVCAFLKEHSPQPCSEKNFLLESVNISMSI